MPLGQAGYVRKGQGGDVLMKARVDVLDHWAQRDGRKPAAKATVRDRFFYIDELAQPWPQVKSVFAAAPGASQWPHRRRYDRIPYGLITEALESDRQITAPIPAERRKVTREEIPEADADPKRLVV